MFNLLEIELPKKFEGKKHWIMFTSKMVGTKCKYKRILQTNYPTQ